MQDALYTTEHSLIDQRLHSRMGAETTNGDGFGVGWYDAEPLPGVSRSIEPAWNDHNLRELARHVTSHLFFAHIRAAIGSAVQQTNCHPFRYGRWLFMQNGFVSDLDALKRELVFAIDPSLYPEIKGQTDTEMLFYLALTLGLEDDPPQAVARAIGLVETIAQQRGVEHPFQGTIATSDGEGLWAFRYSSKGTSGSLFFSRDVRTLRALYPNRQVLQDLAEKRTDHRLRTGWKSARRVDRGAGGKLRDHRPRRGPSGRVRADSRFGSRDDILIGPQEPEPEAHVRIKTRRWCARRPDWTGSGHQKSPGLAPMACRWRKNLTRTG